MYIHTTKTSRTQTKTPFLREPPFSVWFAGTTPELLLTGTSQNNQTGLIGQFANQIAKTRHVYELGGFNVECHSAHCNAETFRLHEHPECHEQH